MNNKNTLRWIKEQPTLPGWYWYRRESGHGIVYVVSDEGSMVASVSWTVQLIPVADFGPNTEWAGPIPEPEEANG